MPENNAGVQTPATPSEIASVRDLHVSLSRNGVRYPALRGVNLEIAPREVLGLVGDDQRRPACQRERRHHPLAEASGELVRERASSLVGLGHAHRRE